MKPSFGQWLHEKLNDNNFILALKMAGYMIAGSLSVGVVFVMTVKFSPWFSLLGAVPILIYLYLFYEMDTT